MSTEAEQIRAASHVLVAAARKVGILRTLSWPVETKRVFFEKQARELPEVEYPPFDARPVHELLDGVTTQLEGDDPAHAWLRRTARAIAGSAELLEATGTPRFLDLSAQLYGLPTGGEAGERPLELAQTFDRLYQEVCNIDLGAPPPACHLAQGVAARIDAACRACFGDEAPEVVVVDSLSSNALAGPRRIQVRRDACFSDRDVDQLIQHEAYVHVGTSLNGLNQPDLPILAAAHAGTTRTQEGLAVFAEFITGALEPERLRRLGDRVLGIQMAVEGADFLEVYRFFLERAGSEDQAFESARRVFRGGVLTGGAPFTKDCVYLDGFLRVTNCLRAVVAVGRLDVLRLLFAGKLDLEDLPALAHLAELGLCREPRYLPPWVADRRYLVTYLTYSTFLNQVRLSDHHEAYGELLAEAPPVWGPAEEPAG